MVYNYLQATSKWDPVIAEDGHEGIPVIDRVLIFGQHSGKFPLDLLINSIYSIPSSLLAQNLSLSLGDHTHINLSRSKTAEKYLSRWKAAMAPTIEMLRNCIDGSKHRLEPSNLDALGMTLNFIPVTRNGILSLLPPHNPHPLPPSMISRHTIIPSHSLMESHNRPPSHTLGSLFNPYEETPHINFTIMPPGIYNKVHHNRPIPCMNWGLVGFTLWLIFPCTPKNMEAWYGSPEMDGARTFQWATTHLTNLSTCIVGPGQRILLRAGDFHSSISLTPVIRASLEFVSHNHLPNILWLQHLGVKLMKEIAADHHGEVNELITSWTDGLEERFFKPFREQWRDKWREAKDSVEQRIQKEENDEGNQGMEEDYQFVLDDAEY